MTEDELFSQGGYKRPYNKELDLNYALRAGTEFEKDGYKKAFYVIFAIFLIGILSIFQVWKISLCCCVAMAIAYFIISYLHNKETSKRFDKLAGEIFLEKNNVYLYKDVHRKIYDKEYFDIQQQLKIAVTYEKVDDFPDASYFLNEVYKESKKEKILKFSTLSYLVENEIKNRFESRLQKT